MHRLDRIRGCLLGGAAGDALGYAVEFHLEEEIFRIYGERGITGNILGAYLGLQGIPQKYRENLELSDVILELADDLYFGPPSDVTQGIWHEKYVACTYGTE